VGRIGLLKCHPCVRFVSFHIFFCFSADDSTDLVGLAELSVALLKRCAQPSTSATASDTKLLLAAIAEAYRQYVGQCLLSAAAERGA
jgi:hypothetical protein